MEQFVQYFQICLVVMARLFAMFVVAPIFSSPVITPRIRLTLAFFATLVIFPIVANSGSIVVPSNTVFYVLAILNEVFIGILIGFFFFVIYSTLQVATGFFEVQVGFSISATVDPLSQISIPVVGQIQNLMGMLILFAIDGHYSIVRTLIYSFQEIPVFSVVSSAVFTSNIEVVIMRLVYYMSCLFSIGLSLALPIVITNFLLSISLGLLAKAAPQMNILLLGFPFQIGLGMTTYLFLIPVVVRSFKSIMAITFKDIFILIEYLGGVTV